ncbi:MAG TPA: pyridoxal phosphate-dependent aminotransferase [Azospirillaceae bacterium]|nr:pyridoxal phosphate-dependent aminotransferase [Azospirillaceae bacterium]
MTASLRPTAEHLSESRIAQVAIYGRGRAGLIPLWFGEGDVPTPDFIADAAHQAMRDGFVFYSDNRGLPDLRESLARYLGRVHGKPVDAERIVVTSSGMAAIMMAFQAILDPGDEVAIVAPVWPNAFAAVEVMNGKPVEVPLTLGNAGWTLDLERLFAACGPRTRAIFINTPGNPTGWVMPLADMRRVLDFAKSRGIWVISDEVYSRIVYDRPAAPSFLEFAEPDDPLIVVNSFSKNWCMTGWRMGWSVAPAHLTPVFAKLIQFNYSGTPPFVQKAGVAAIEQGEGVITDLVDRCRRGRAIVQAALERLPRVRLAPMDGAFYAFFQVEGMTDSLEFAKRLVDEAGVGLAPGSAFGASGEGWLRLCFASSPALLEEAMARLSRALA